VFSRLEQVGVFREILFVRPFHLVRGDIDAAIEKCAEEFMFQLREAPVLPAADDLDIARSQIRAQCVEGRARGCVHLAVPGFRMHHDQPARTARLRDIAGAL
jgi:hypothetical protein